MHSSFVIAALSGLALANAQAAPVPGTTGQLGDADITTENPAGVTYTATLLDKNTTTIRGYIAATSSSNGTGVNFNVNLFGFTDFATQGPYSKLRMSYVLSAYRTKMSVTVYHIHDQPVPANGNCTATLAHQDPYVRGEVPPCDPTHPETCQVGDLSGKHGNITTTPFQAS